MNRYFKKTGRIIKEISSKWSSPFPHAEIGCRGNFADFFCLVLRHVPLDTPRYFRFRGRSVWGLDGPDAMILRSQQKWLANTIPLGYGPIQSVWQVTRNQFQNAPDILKGGIARPDKLHQHFSRSLPIRCLFRSIVHDRMRKRRIFLCIQFCMH